MQQSVLKASAFLPPKQRVTAGCLCQGQSPERHLLGWSSTGATALPFVCEECSHTFHCQVVLRKWSRDGWIPVLCDLVWEALSYIPSAEKSHFPEDYSRETVHFGVPGTATSNFYANQIFFNTWTCLCHCDYFLRIYSQADYDRYSFMLSSMYFWLFDLFLKNINWKSECAFQMPLEAAVGVRYRDGEVAPLHMSWCLGVWSSVDPLKANYVSGPELREHLFWALRGDEGGHQHTLRCFGSVVATQVTATTYGWQYLAAGRDGGEEAQSAMR